MFSSIKGKRAGIILGFLLLGVSCQRFFMPVRYDAKNEEEAAQFFISNKAEKYFILHHNDKSYALNDISIDKDKLVMNGKLSPVDPSHLSYIKAKGKGYKYNDKNRVVLNEVHFYVMPASTIDTVNTLELPLYQVSKIEVIEHDKARTTQSYVLGGIGIGVGVIAVTTVIILLTKESCPYISVYDGEEYQLQGELFGGSVNSRLERMDYVPLQAMPVNGEFRLRLSNELKEKQYTNLADLVVIEHNVNSTVLPGTDGKPYAFRDPVMPVAAEMNQGKNMMDAVTYKDNIACGFDDTTISTGLNELRLRFRNTGTKGKGKLLLNLKNTYWLDFLYGEFTRHFGSTYESWKERQQSRTAEEMTQWTEEQYIPLTVSLKTKNGWKEIQKIKTIGPVANRELIVPVETGDAEGDFVDIRLQTGFMFWEVDYAAMDFTHDEPFTITRLKPSAADDQDGNSVLPELKENDQLYLAQPRAGDYAILRYPFDRKPGIGRTYSVFFETSGYYEPIREYSGKADKAFLKKFRQPGCMARFSLARYQTISSNSAALAVKN